MAILDSGNRREFNSGAVRDIQEGKGRCDLLPLAQIAQGYKYCRPEICTIFDSLDSLLRAENDDVKNDYINKIVRSFNSIAYNAQFETSMLELAKHYEEGAKKYSERNWEKGIPTHCFIDSGVRHLLKYIRGDKDEPHDRAFLWNMFGYMWTVRNHHELDDFMIKNKERGTEE